MPSRIVGPKEITLARGERVQCTITPPPGPGCRVVIELQVEGESDWTNISGADVDGNTVPTVRDIDGFYRTQNATGQVALEARNGPARGKVRMIVICEEEPGDHDFDAVITPINQPAGGPPISITDPIIDLLKGIGRWVWNGVRYVLLPVTFSWWAFWHFMCWLARILAKMGFVFYVGGGVEDGGSSLFAWFKVEWFCPDFEDAVGPLWPDELGPYFRHPPPE
jgi:hypothetical protein